MEEESVGHPEPDILPDSDRAEDENEAAEISEVSNETDTKSPIQNQNSSPKKPKSPTRELQK